jgi:hypothetical protein
MQITVEIPDEFAAQVQARGLNPESYVRGLVDEAIRGIPMTSGPVSKRMGMREFVEKMSANSSNFPELPDEAFTRASFYMDHD